MSSNIELRVRPHKRKARLFAVLAGVAALTLIAWLLVPGSFGRGMIVGAVSAIGVLFGSLVLLSRRMKKRMGVKLKPPPLPTEAWDYTMDLTDLEGVTALCSQFSGKVVVLNFWATWCTPCIAEMPSLQGLRDRTADLGVRFACISSEEPDAVRKFIDKRAIELPMYFLVGEPPECFTSRAIPATYVLDRTGMIALRHIGAASWDAERVVAFVRGLAAAPAA